MIKYEVGKPFPHEGYRGRDAVYAMVNEAFFDIVIVINKPTQSEKKTIKHEPMRYGAYIENSVPFVIIDFRFQDLNFDCSINFHKVSEKDRENWFKEKSNAMNIFLVDSTTYNLEAIRFVGVELDFASVLKDSLKEQIEFLTLADVENTISKIYQLYPTNELIKKTKMYNL